MSLCTDFDTSSPAAKPIVNYAWLCPRDTRATRADYGTRLPLHYMTRLYENTARYPEAVYNLWLDFDQIAPNDRFFLQSHQYLFDTPNITLRNLRDIPAYSGYPGFDRDSNIALYARADFARVLVLDHIQRNHPESIAIYSDLDCEDIMIEDKLVNTTLTKCGTIFGHSGRSIACNGYIALCGDQGRTFMKDYLLPKTEAAFQKNLVNHFGAFSKAITEYRDKYHPSVRREQLGLVPMPPMRSLMPYDADMYEGACPIRDTRVPYSKDLV